MTVTFKPTHALPNTDHSDEVEAMIAYLNSLPIPVRITYTTNHAYYTLAGYPSNHRKPGTNGVGLALDCAGISGGRDTKELGDIFRAIATPTIIPITHELIYAGPQVDWNVKNGTTVPKYAQESHHDHVHWAVKLGGVTIRTLNDATAKNKNANANTNKNANEGDDDMQIAPSAITDSLPCTVPDCRGWWELIADGGVRTEGPHTADHFFGSYFTLDAKHRNAPRTFLTITPRRDRAVGYVIYANDGAYYTFGPETK